MSSREAGLSSQPGLSPSYKFYNFYKRKRPEIMKRTALITGGAALAATAAALFAAPAATASPVPGQPNCDRVPWGFLGSQVRAICDGPIQPDGSWVRGRAIVTPAHYVPMTTSCYGTYSVTCTSYGGYYVDTVVNDNEQYVVTSDTVLPDEPGYLGGGSAPAARSIV